MSRRGWSVWSPPPLAAPPPPPPRSRRTRLQEQSSSGQSAGSIPARTSGPAVTPQSAPAAQPQRTAPAPTAGTTIRKEINAMSGDEQNRFVAALNEMIRLLDDPLTESLQQGSGPEEELMVVAINAKPQRTREYRSVFHKLASYHNDFCAHGREPFPGWHRAYLLEFEYELQEADKRLGGDGKIGLPYWNWAKNQRLPPIIRANYSVQPPELDGLVGPGYQITDDRTLARYLAGGDVGTHTANALADQQQHWQFASTEQGGDTLESVHNNIHVYCGWPMSSVPSAAYHPIFWLHHCNIDRLYDGYLKAHPESMDEWEDHAFAELQRTTARRGIRLPAKADKAARAQLRDSNGSLVGFSAFEKPLAPFRHRQPGSLSVAWAGNGRSGTLVAQWAKGQPFMPTTCLSSVALGYSYDEVPDAPLPGEGGEQMREVPTLAIWKNVDPVGPLANKAYTVHVFVIPKADLEAWVAPSSVDEVMDHPGYAGNTAVFGGRTQEECDNCKTRRPISIFVDISAKIQELNLSRWNAGLRVMCQDQMGALMPLADTPLGEPVIDGPYFEAPDLMLQAGAGERQEVTYDEAKAQEQVVGEVTQLQEYMHKFGYYEGKVDGDFGPKTEAAVRRLQKVLGVTVDGIAGPETRKAMLRTRVDPLMDGGAEYDKATFKPGQTVRWWMGVSPGYLVDEDVRYEICHVMEQWSAAVPLRFEEVAHAVDAHLKFEWANHTSDGSFKFDGAGGSLAHCEDNVITFDNSELWLLQGDPSRPKAFYLLPVMLHEVGHALGLRHSEVVDDVMSPFYDPEKITLRQEDRLRVALLYNMEEAFTDAFKELDIDKDDKLIKEEFLSSMTTRGSHPLTQAEAEAMWAKADPNGTGKVELPAFLELMSSLFFDE